MVVKFNFSQSMQHNNEILKAFILGKKIKWGYTEVYASQISDICTSYQVWAEIKDTDFQKILRGLYYGTYMLFNGCGNTF